MEKVTFHVVSIMRFKLDMVDYPELSSPKKWIQKSILLLKKYTPDILKYLSKEKVISRLKDCDILIESHKGTRNEIIKQLFKIWIQKERVKRLIFVVFEALVIPLTPILALLPGPNVFFYVPALMLYFHFFSFRGLSQVDVDDLHLEIRHKPSAEI